jgi:hypothetical protein
VRESWDVRRFGRIALWFIDESPTAGTVLVVIVYRDLDGVLRGVNVWPATDLDLEIYRLEADDGEED